MKWSGAGSIRSIRIEDGSLWSKIRLVYVHRVERETGDFETLDFCIRSSDGKRTASRSLCEVKPHSAESVLARGTSMERSVMNTFFFFFLPLTKNWQKMTKYQGMRKPACPASRDLKNHFYITRGIKKWQTKNDQPEFQKTPREWNCQKIDKKLPKNCHPRWQKKISIESWNSEAAVRSAMVKLVGWHTRWQFFWQKIFWQKIRLCQNCQKIVALCGKKIVSRISTFWIGRSIGHGQISRLSKFHFFCQIRAPQKWQFCQKLANCHPIWQKEFWQKTEILNWQIDRPRFT